MKIFISWVLNVVGISAWLHQNCGFFINSQIFGQSDFHLLTLYIGPNIGSQSQNTDSRFLKGDFLSYISLKSWAKLFWRKMYLHSKPTLYLVFSIPWLFFYMWQDIFFSGNFAEMSLWTLIFKSCILRWCSAIGLVVLHKLREVSKIAFLEKKVQFYWPTDQLCYAAASTRALTHGSYQRRE